MCRKTIVLALVTLELKRYLKQKLGMLKVYLIGMAWHGMAWCIISHRLPGWGVESLGSTPQTSSFAAFYQK
jgi:hypothetical protein